MKNYLNSTLIFNMEFFLVTKVTKQKLFEKKSSGLPNKGKELCFKLYKKILSSHFTIQNQSS